MIAWRDALLMPVVEGLSSQPIRRDSVVAVAARSRLNVRMPGAAQDVAGPSSAGTRLPRLAAALNVSEGNQIRNEWISFELVELQSFIQ